MADPLLDKISLGTLEALKKDIVYDNLFDDSFGELYISASEWEKNARRRMKAMKVTRTRRDEVIAEMRKARGEPEPKLKLEPQMYVSEVGSWDGGNVIEEPITYGKLERGK